MVSARDVVVKYTKLFINNEFVDSVSGKTFPTLNPTNGQTIVEIAEGDKEDVDKAVAAAKNQFERNSEWRQMDASARGILINKLADLIERDKEYLMHLETLDNGKPLPESEFDMNFAISVLRYYAGYADKIHGNTIPADGGNFTVTRKEPVGVVGQIIPWNYPLMMVSWKLGPALAAGCTIVLKPAEQTPLTALAAAALSKEAGFPPGVINIVPGYGATAGAALALHPDVKKIAFTGSVEIGRKIMEYAAKSNLKNVTLELGGKCPVVIFNDADLDQSVEIAYGATFANHGQNCCAGGRIFVQSEIYDDFVRKIVDKVRARKVGDPFTSDVDQGPQIDQRSLDKILRLIASGKEQGAKLEIGGEQVGNEGYFVQPTVFSGVEDHMTIATEEIFGPVQCIFKFKTLEEAIERANNSVYGLAAGIITKDINKAVIFAQAAEAGTVWVNCYDAMAPQAPFGGYKISGIGRELGADAIAAYIETKTISINVPVRL